MVKSARLEGEMVENSVYDSVYYATLCHVCKCNPGEQKKIKRCASCKMVSYCSIQHQKIHWPLHKDFCKCIQSELASRDAEHLFEEAHKCNSAEDWRKLRFNTMLVIQLKICRRLSSGEQQMFLFPRVCEVCRKVVQENFEDCQYCHCITYCSLVHKEQDSLKHDKACKLLNLCFLLDKHFIFETDPYPRFFVPVENEYNLLPSDIETFITSSKMKLDLKNISQLSEHVKLALMSDLLTCPLTLLYALENQEIKLRNNACVHVVGASGLECLMPQQWEVILHCLPQIKFLKIVFIGPEIEHQESFSLCTDCLMKERELSVDYQKGKLYHQYVTSQYYLVPDIIVAYNCGLHEYEGSEKDTWLLSLPYLVKCNNVPLVLTSYTKSEAQKDIARIFICRKSALKVFLNSAKNPFASKRPHRDWGQASSSVFFHNNFISVVLPY